MPKVFIHQAKDIIVTDNEHVIAVAGTFKKDLVGKKFLLFRGEITKTYYSNI